MKITIELTEAEAQGITNYLRECQGVEKPTPDDVRKHVRVITENGMYDDKLLMQYINQEIN